jgi:NAD(P)-dependent dehydrogenase (short-subunit alcohol dehydrogenase family)
MDLQLTGKRALVTGSTAGIGFAIACALAAEGAHVTLNGRSRSGVSAAVVRLIEAVPGARVDGVAADLSSAAGCEALTATCADVDILVNNLGIFDPRPFEEIQDIEWFNFFETNVMSGVRLSRHYLPAMKARDWGRIVFISSESGICPPAEMVHYGMSKSAQLSVARGMAETCVGSGVTVNSVLPARPAPKASHVLRAPGGRAGRVPGAGRAGFLRPCPADLAAQAPHRTCRGGHGHLRCSPLHLPPTARP